jgi:acetylornithine aminotransferase
VGRSTRAGERFTEALLGAPHVVSVRGRGLLLAVELDVPSADAARVLLDRGVVVNAVTPTALRLAPSLLISDEEIDAGVAALLDAAALVADRTDGGSAQ